MWTLKAQNLLFYCLASSLHISETWQRHIRRSREAQGYDHVGVIPRYRTSFLTYQGLCETFLSLSQILEGCTVCMGIMDPLLARNQKHLAGHTRLWFLTATNLQIGALVQSLESQTIAQLLWFSGLFYMSLLSIIRDESNPDGLSNIASSYWATNISSRWSYGAPRSFTTACPWEACGLCIFAYRVGSHTKRVGRIAVNLYWILHW